MRCRPAFPGGASAGQQQLPAKRATATSMCPVRRFAPGRQADRVLAQGNVATAEAEMAARIGRPEPADAYH